MIEPAPAYRGEGPHVLWHVSEDAAIARFEPHHRPGQSLDEPLVWAVDTRHLPLYWFPRECVDRHAKAHIELAVDDDLAALWQRVIASMLDFSGIRLRNATMAA